jgi:hypothetical protein
MKTLAVALAVVGFIAGCASHESYATSYPGASPRSYTTKSECESAGRTWSGISGVCM